MPAARGLSCSASCQQVAKSVADAPDQLRQERQAPPPSLFTLIDRPNADVAGGARGRQSVPKISALDLSKLFARQQ